MTNTKRIGNYEILKCTAVAVSAGDSEENRQEALLFKDLRYENEYFIVLNVPFQDLETEADFDNIDYTDCSSFQEDIESVKITTRAGYVIRQNTLQESDSQHSKILESFDSLKKAKKALEKYKSRIDKMGKVWSIIYIEEAKYVTDYLYKSEELVDGGNICAFASIVLGKEENNETI